MTVWGETAGLYAYHHKDTPEVLTTEIFQGKAQATSALLRKLERSVKVDYKPFEPDDDWPTRRHKLAAHHADRKRLAKEEAKDYVLVTFSLVRND